MKKKIISLALPLVIIITLIMSVYPVSAVTYIIPETVNIAAARQNIHGHGYEWANRTSTLTLSNCYINTKDDFGLRLPGECTVILEGNNYIRAEKYAISCAGNVIFKGKGTLLIEAGEIGIYLISQDNTTKVRILSGDYRINAGKYGVFSEYTDFSLAGGKMDITATGEDSRAILGRAVNLVGGAFTSDSTVEATHSLLVDSVDIDVSSDSAALVSKNLTVRNESIEGLDGYNGENEIKASAVKRHHSESIIFGSGVSGWVDYILLFAVLAAVAACIVLPILHKKKKKKELYERLKREGYTL